MQDQVHIKSSWGGINYERGFQDIVEVVNNLDCAWLLWRDDNDIHQTKYDGIYG